MPIPEPKAKHNHATLKFPEGFLWGAATSGHQVEGNNTDSDWWAWEQKHRPPEERSGEADDQYNRYREDFQMAKDLGHNAHRLSIEWSRIEPEEGQFSQDAIDHYREVLKDLKDKEFEVMLTLNHFTIPEWLAKKGGFESFSFPRYYMRFLKKIIPEYKEYVNLWLTFNEPGSIAWMSYLYGLWPPSKRSFISAAKVYFNLARAHKRAYRYIHRVEPKAMVGVTTNINSFEEFHNHRIWELLSVWSSDLVANHLFYILTGKKTHDFLGFDYYFNWYITSASGVHIPKRFDVIAAKKNMSDLGWEIRPEGIFDVLMDFSDFGKPVYITENGLASTNDDRRCRFLVAYLQEIYHAISAGVDVRGYFHWSLIDNFEWADGFEPRFGLVEVNYSNQKRTPRPSAYVYKDIIEHDGIPHYLLKFIGHTVEADDVLKNRD